MLINFDTDHVIHLYFPAFAGGKFLTNTLSLSRHSIIADLRFAEQDLAYQTFDNNFYQFKLNSILTFLPSVEDRHNWRSYEFREWQLNGIDSKDYATKTVEQIKNHKFNPIIKKIIDSKRTFFFLSHYYDETVGFKQVWPNAKIITMVNWNKFIALAGSFKRSSGEDNLAHLDFLLDHSTTLPFPSLIFDVDHSIFSRDNFLRSIKLLYQALEWDDFQENLVGHYYDAYREIHGY